jgi:hypothetical protein
MVSVKAAEAKLLCAWVGEYKKDHKQFIPWSGNYSEMAVSGIMDFRSCKGKIGHCCIQVSGIRFRKSGLAYGFQINGWIAALYFSLRTEPKVRVDTQKDYKSR